MSAVMRRQRQGVFAWTQCHAPVLRAEIKKNDRNLAAFPGLTGLVDGAAAKVNETTEMHETYAKNST
jgi:hypothetical protein